MRLFLLAAGLFVFLTAELYPVGAMPDMVATLGNSESEIGRLVTWYAVGVGVATIPIVILTQRMARRTVIVGTLAMLAASMGVAAAAPNLTVVAAARLLGAAAHGGIFAVVPVAAASLGQRGRESQAVAQAFLGASTGVVAGPPFVAFVSQHLGWRWASGSIAALAALIAVASWFLLPALPAAADANNKLSLRLPKSMRPAFIVICACTAVVVLAHNAVYAFIAPIMESHGVSGTGYAVTLFVYGVAGALTTAYASRHLDAHPLRVMLTGLTCMVVSLVALAVLPGAIAGVIAAVCWGGSFGVLPVALQTSVLTVTPGHNDAATPIYVVAFQVGISTGALIGSVLILHLSATQLPLLGAAVTACVIPALALGLGARKPRSIKA